jgi:hypothetical protein
MESTRTEHLGFNSISSQILSCRSFIDVAIPFADRNLMNIVSNLTFKERIHNSLSRRLILAYAPELGNYPTASTLISGKFPILLQEFTRFIKRMHEDLKWLRYYKAKDIAILPNTDYMNLEELRQNTVLRDIADDLRHPLLDKKKIHSALNAFLKYDAKIKGRIFAFQFKKIYTIDLLSRLM